MQEIRVRHSEKEDIPAIKEIYEGESAYSGTLQLPYPSLKLWESRLENLSKGVYSLVAEQNSDFLTMGSRSIFFYPHRLLCG